MFYTFHQFIQQPDLYLPKLSYLNPFHAGVLLQRGASVPLEQVQPIALYFNIFKLFCKIC